MSRRSLTTTSIVAEGGSVTIHRQTAIGYDVVISSLPALVSVTAGVVEPRYPTFKGIMDAKKKQGRHGHCLRAWNRPIQPTQRSGHPSPPPPREGPVGKDRGRRGVPPRHPRASRTEEGDLSGHPMGFRRGISSRDHRPLVSSYSTKSAELGRSQRHPLGRPLRFDDLAILGRHAACTCAPRGHRVIGCLLLPWRPP